MATINNIYVWVEVENVDKSVILTTHPREKSIATTDTVKAEPVTLSISGKIVPVGGDSAKDIIDKIEKLMNAGSLITYSGVETLKNLQIKRFPYQYSNKTWGGADFSMELQEASISDSPYKQQSKTTVAKTKTPTKTDIKVGSIVVFTGGNVYVSSDAKKAAAKRSRSTCKVTNINKKSWSIHQYHLISTDGKKVYGWCDLSNITVSSSSQPSTAKKTNGGTQQLK